MNLIRPDQLDRWVGPWIGPTPWCSYLHEPEKIYELEAKFERQYPAELHKKLARKLKLGDKEKKRMQTEKAKTIANELVTETLAYRIINYATYFGDYKNFSGGGWKKGFTCNPPTPVLQIINYLKTLELFDDFLIRAEKKHRGVLLGKIHGDHYFLIARWGEDLIRHPTLTDLHRVVLSNYICNKTSIEGIPYPVWNYLWEMNRQQKSFYELEISVATNIPIFWNNKHCGMNRYKIDPGYGVKPVYICPKCGIYTGGPKDFQPTLPELIEEPVAITEHRKYFADIKNQKEIAELEKIASEIVFLDEVREIEPRNPLRQNTREY